MTKPAVIKPVAMVINMYQVVLDIYRPSKCDHTNAAGGPSVTLSCLTLDWLTPKLVLMTPHVTGDACHLWRTGNEGSHSQITKLWPLSHGRVWTTMRGSGWVENQRSLLHSGEEMLSGVLGLWEENTPLLTGRRRCQNVHLEGLICLSRS